MTSGSAILLPSNQLPPAPSPLLLLLLQGVIQSDGLRNRESLRAQAKTDLLEANRRLSAAELQARQADGTIADSAYRELADAKADLTTLLAQIQPEKVLDPTALPFVPDSKQSIAAPEAKSDRQDLLPDLASRIESFQMPSASWTSVFKSGADARRRTGSDQTKRSGECEADSSTKGSSSAACLNTAPVSGFYGCKITPVYDERIHRYRALRAKADFAARERRKVDTISIQQLAVSSLWSQSNFPPTAQTRKASALLPPSTAVHRHHSDTRFLSPAPTFVDW